LPRPRSGANIEEAVMAVHDRIRLNIRQRLEPLIGVEEADALVTHALSPTIDELATKADVALVQADVGLVRVEMASLGRELRAEMNAMEARLGSETRDLIIGQTRWLVGFVVGWSGVVLALANWLFR
jgi:hypothetical protein